MPGQGSFPFVPVSPPQQPIGSGGGMGSSPLVVAMLGKPSNFSLPPVNSQLSIPLMSMLMNQQPGNQPGGGREGVTDPFSAQQWGNVLQGYQRDGMPGSSMLASLLGNGMSPLVAQAQSNIAGFGGAGGPIDPYGGQAGAYGNGPI